MLRFSLKAHLVGAAALALIAGGAVSAQGLDQKLEAAEQKLSQDEQACRPVNIAHYASLLNEASQNKRRADRARQAGVPVDDVQVNADLVRAAVLLHKAHLALATQCVRQATQQQTAPPQTTGTSQNAQGLTQSDADRIASQLGTIEEFESALAELKSLLEQGRCGEAGYLVDELDEWLDELSGMKLRYGGLGPSSANIPRSMILEWDRRIDELLESCPRPQPFPQTATLDPLARIILDTHNGERAALGLQPFSWNPSLANNAQAYANRLARTGQLQHASREGRGTERENISSGLPGWSAVQLMDNWLKEKPLFRAGVFPNISATGNWADAGHYSQIIWPDTTDLGCGMAIGGGFSWLVCRYNPGGNKDGKPVGYPVTLAESPNWNAGPSSTPTLIKLGLDGETFVLTDPFLDGCPTIFPEDLNVFDLAVTELFGNIPSPPVTRDLSQDDFMSPREFRLTCGFRF